MSLAPRILLPPSEGKTDGGRGASISTNRRLSFPELDTTRDSLISCLRAAVENTLVDHKKLFSVKGEALAKALTENAVVTDSPTMPAIRRYDGVLFGELNYPSLSADARRRANSRIVIFSGLFGLVKPNDPIPSYKLKMGATLPPVGGVTAIWKNELSPVLNNYCANRIVWDLLPNEHRAAWITDDHSKQRITVRFVDRHGSGKNAVEKTVNHWNKLLKGSLVRFLLEYEPAGIDGLSEFEHPLGYVYTPDRTQISEKTVSIDFVRHAPRL